MRRGLPIRGLMMLALAAFLLLPVSGALAGDGPADRVVWEKRLDTLDAKDAAAAYKLALQLESKGHDDLASKAYEIVIGIEPDHLAARRALGYEKINERWHTGDDLLRAIGYQRNMVALSFIIESSFVTLLGIGSGVAMAIWLSYFLLTSNEFPVVDYVVPWGQIAFISGLAFFASLVMTYIPSRQAASVPIAEALRYE